jgi:hypothetical protein
MQDESSLAGHVGERAPRSTEGPSEGGPEDPLQRPAADQEDFQDLDSASSADDEAPDQLSRSTSQSVPPDLRTSPSGEASADADAVGGTGDRPGDHAGTLAAVQQGSGGLGSGGDAGGSGDVMQSGGVHVNGKDGGNTAGAAGQGNEENGASSSALEAFLEGGMDALAVRRPGRKASTYQRYNLEAAVPSGRDLPGEDGADDQAGGTPGGSGPRPKHLSAKQRKLLKQARVYCYSIQIMMEILELVHGE